MTANAKKAAIRTKNRSSCTHRLLTGKAQAQVLRLHKTQITDEASCSDSASVVRPRWLNGHPSCAPSWKNVRRCPVKRYRCTLSTVVSASHTARRLQSDVATADERVGRTRNERFTFHDLRAKAVTDLIEDGRKASEADWPQNREHPAKVYGPSGR